MWLLLFGGTVFIALMIQVLEATWPYCSTRCSNPTPVEASLSPSLVVYRLGSGTMQDSPTHSSNLQGHQSGGRAHAAATVAAAKAARTKAAEPEPAGRTAWDRSGQRGVMAGVNEERRVRLKQERGAGGWGVRHRVREGKRARSGTGRGVQGT